MRLLNPEDQEKLQRDYEERCDPSNDELSGHYKGLDTGVKAQNQLAKESFIEWFEETRWACSYPNDDIWGLRKEDWERFKQLAKD